jgi:hypothetical protein
LQAGVTTVALQCTSSQEPFPGQRMEQVEALQVSSLHEPVPLHVTSATLALVTRLPQLPLPLQVSSQLPASQTTSSLQLAGPSQTMAISVAPPPMRAAQLSSP